ncbi:histidine--tRNA ligase [Candidatus Saccharibacteria bacterium 32-49-12]|nr:MAG: histidine--tRNA ligase [Candidatus Saccharibacteria bacterium 32-49-12]
MSNLSTQSYKGTRDYYPEDKRLQNYIFKVWREAAEGFGYEEYGAPLIEPLEIYTAKSGQELAGEQTYAFQDRGERMVAIRPEMTPSVSRMVAARRQEMPMPSRLYSIANFMRYERPQRGREREFWQLNADLFGVEGAMADAEIIELSYACVMGFGATEDMFKIRVNNRQLINQLMSEFLGLDFIGATMMTKLLDKKDKLPVEEFKRQAISIFGADAEKGLPKLADLISISTLEALPPGLANLPSVVEMRQVMQSLKKKGINNVVFDVTLMRGLDYYTGTVFEFFDTSPENNRALFGGGRYDGLVGLFGVEPVATVGVGLGATTMQQFLEVHKLLPRFASHTDVYVAVVDESVVDGADALARKLRSEGVRVELDITGRKLDKQIKTALKKQIPFVAFVGEDELSSGVYTVRNLVDSSEEKMDAVRMVTVVRDRRYDGDDDAVFEV